MILLDTHVLLWWVSNPEKLSPNASALIKKEVKNGQILVSSISTWEIYMLVKKDRLKLSLDVGSWLAKIESLPFIRFIPVDNKIAAKSVTLPGEFHSDPADRMITATARETGATLVTSDEKIRKYSFVQSLW